MSRNQFSDMTPRKRSIRDIPIRNKVEATSRPVERPIERMEKKDQQDSIERIEVKNIKDGYFSDLGKPRSTKKGGKKKWLLILIIIIAGFWGASVFLHAASVHIIPEKAQYQGTVAITAKTDAAPTELQYDSLQFIETASKKVAAAVEETVSIKASGKIMIYNNYSTTPQKLIANTRFESADGKIYRIQQEVTVPGYKTSGGEKVPGSIEATVHADAAGESFNGTKTDFTIPGFKGTPQYQGFYARSTTDITGGFIGKQKKIDAALLASTTEALQKEIEGKLAQSIISKIPSDFIFLSGGHTIEYTVKPIKAEGNQGIVTVEGNVRAYVFKKDGIDRAMRQSATGISAERVVAHDYTGISVHTITEIAESGSLTAKLSGEAILYAAIDKDTLIKELVGVDKKSIGTIMNKHPEVVESHIYIRPPWMLSLPKNPERIHIIEQIDE